MELLSQMTREVPAWLVNPLKCSGSSGMGNSVYGTNTLRHSYFHSGGDTSILNGLSVVAALSSSSDATLALLLRAFKVFLYGHL